VWSAYHVKGYWGNGLGSSGRDLLLRPLCEWLCGRVEWGVVKLREWVAAYVGCECFNRVIAEVGGDGLPASPV
jgi:hypothetical protein